MTATARGVGEPDAAGSSAAAVLREAAGHWRAGRLEAAARACEAVLRDDPAEVDALNLAAIVAFQAGNAERALELIQTAIAARPGEAKLHSNLGLILAGSWRFEEAAEAHRAAVARAPDSADAQTNLGLSLAELGQFDAAEAAQRRAVELAPNHPGILCNLGSVLRKRRQPEQAIAVFHAALDRDPAWAPAWCNLGLALADLDRLDEGIAALRRAIEANPRLAEAHDNLGVLLLASGAVEEALAAHRIAQSLDPRRAEAYWHEALTLLLMGDLAAGWAAYEWRWRAKFGRGRMRHAGLPAWDGSPPAGRTILLWGEQGIGDQIMFSVYLRDLLAGGANCVVEADVRLEPILIRSFPEIRFVPQREQSADLPDVDWQIAMGSLGRWLRPSLAAFPAHDGYLRADPGMTERLRARYREWSDGRPLVGISWRGGPPDRPSVVRARSLALLRWAPILRPGAAAFVSLQYGDHAAEVAGATAALGVPILCESAINPLASIDAQAAQISAMDLVISIDNATVHLAGALGKPVWVLLPAAPDWRWLLDRDSSPWYPSVRLFRQSRRGAWDEVLQTLAAALAGRDWERSGGLRG